MSLTQYLSISASDPIIDTDVKTKLHTIKVTDTYTVAADDSLKMKGNIGFKLLAGRDGPVSLDIEGSVTMNSDKHGKLGGIVSTSAPNGVVNVTLGDDAQLTVNNGNPTATFGAAGVTVAVGTATFVSGGDIHVTAALGQAGGVGLFGLDLSFDNSGDIHATSTGGEALGVMLTGGVADGVNSGTIEAEGLTYAVGLATSASSASTLRNDGQITATGATAFAMQATGAFTSVINTGDLTATSTAASSSGFNGAGGLFLGGSSLGGVSGAYAVDNSGNIHADGGAGALAVGVAMYGGVSFHNSGDIEATSASTGPEPIHSAGVVFALNPGATVTNDGTISGQYSIVAVEVASTGPGGLPADDIIVNNGTLIGQVALGGGADSLANHNSIQGMVDMGAGDDSFDSHDGQLTGAVYGGVGSDTVIGSAGADTLYGDAQDTSGGAGAADTITGGGGADTITGGDGNDVFKFTAVGDFNLAAHDLITDLTNGDSIDLSAIDADTSSPGSDQAFHLVTISDGRAGELTVAYDSGTGLTTIAGDTDGDGTADLVITVSGDHSDFTNFVL